jgi:hypothetical protein
MDPREGDPMRGRVFFVVIFLLASAGCGSKSSISLSGTSVPRSYNGTASVGDFLTITLDPAAQTLLYTNLSNGDSGTVPYTVNSDGTYSLNDPHGNLVAAYEVPNYALIVQAAKTGPNRDMPALVTAVQKGSISVSTWAGKQYNFMQFRTSSGGMEVGSVNIDGHGSVSVSSYWPYGGMDPNGSPFNQSGFDVNLFQSDPSGTFLKLADDNGTSFDYVFGTPNGVFAVDTPNGAILGLKKAASKDFNPTSAGTYKAIYYQKVGATTGAQNLEIGTPSLGRATLEVTAAGEVTMRDGQGSIMVQATLTPVADTSYLYGGGSLADPCYGLFTFRVTTSSSQQDVFLAFMDQSMLFSSIRSDLPWQAGNPYDYFYGVGLK